VNLSSADLTDAADFQIKADTSLKGKSSEGLKLEFLNEVVELSNGNSCEQKIMS
jgi:hypothetical protein